MTDNHHERDFALCSMRSKTLSRYYVQCPPDYLVNSKAAMTALAENYVGLPY